MRSYTQSVSLTVGILSVGPSIRSSARLSLTFTRRFRWKRFTNIDETSKISHRIFLGDIAEKVISPIGIDVCCLSRSCILLKQKKISYAHDSPMPLPDGVKIWLTSVNPFSNFTKNWATPVDLSAGDIRWQIAAEWLQIASVE